MEVLSGEYWKIKNSVTLGVEEFSLVDTGIVHSMKQMHNLECIVYDKDVNEIATNERARGVFVELALESAIPQSAIFSLEHLGVNRD